MAVLLSEGDREHGVHGHALADLIRQSAEEQGTVAGDLSKAYLETLTRLPLDELKREPVLVATETSTVETELINLCFREYPTFVSVHRCSAAVQAAFDDFDTSLKALMGSVPSLEEECRAFVDRTRSTQNSRSKAALVQENQDKLLDLVEIPRLMETSVRNGYYQEAMELAAHARGLHLRHPGVPFIESTYAEVENVAQVMLAQLVSSLREPVKLPILIKAVGYLRRLGSMEEDELGVIFLISRLHNFQAAVQQIERERDDAVRYLRRYIDLFREHIYDIISQFSSIFQDSSLLVSFSERCIDDLIQLIRTQVPRIGSDTASLSSILVQLGYCAASFSRVGLDFTALVTEPFLTTISDMFSNRAQRATAAFINLLQSPAALDDPASLTSQVYSAQSSPSGQQLEIASFPVLAQYVNEYLSSLNALRLLAPISLRKRLGQTLSNSIRTVSTSLLAFADRALDSDQSKASSTSSKMWRRSSDAMMTLEARTIKREQCKEITIALVAAFRCAALPLICRALQEGVYEGGERPETLLSTIGETSVIENLDAWLQANGPAPAAGPGVSSNVTQLPRDGNGPNDSRSHPPGMIAEEEVIDPTNDSPVSARPPTASDSNTTTVDLDGHRGETRPTTLPENELRTPEPSDSREAPLVPELALDGEAATRDAVPAGDLPEVPTPEVEEVFQPTDRSAESDRPSEPLVLDPVVGESSLPATTETGSVPAHKESSDPVESLANDTPAFIPDVDAPSGIQEATADARSPGEPVSVEQDSAPTSDPVGAALNEPEPAGEDLSPMSGIATPSENLDSTPQSEVGDNVQAETEIGKEDRTDEADSASKKKKKKRKGKK